jgi:hypothetical protein
MKKEDRQFLIIHLLFRALPIALYALLAINRKT